MLLKNKPTLQRFEWEEENSKGKKKKKIHAVEVLGSVKEVRPQVDILGQIHSYYKWAKTTDSYVQQWCVWG